jgi:hypothetical protein
MYLAVGVFLALAQVISAPGQWKVDESVSKMDDSRTVALMLSAGQTISGWPSKKVIPVLILRCQEKEVNAYVVTGMASQPELGKHKEATIRVRFDGAPAKTLIASTSTSNDSLFLPKAKSMITTMAASKTMVFQFTPFNSDPAEASFDLRGLDGVLPKLRTACGWK